MKRYEALVVDLGIHYICKWFRNVFKKNSSWYLVIYQRYLAV